MPFLGNNGAVVARFWLWWGELENGRGRATRVKGGTAASVQGQYFRRDRVVRAAFG